MMTTRVSCGCEYDGDAGPRVRTCLYHAPAAAIAAALTGEQEARLTTKPTPAPGSAEWWHQVSLGLASEVARLRGIQPEFPPRPPHGDGLPRYGIRHNGPTEPLAVPMSDGYWTPWHLAERIRLTQPGRLTPAQVALHAQALAGLQGMLTDSDDVRAGEAQAALAALLEALARDRKVCQWKGDDDGIWDTACGRRWEYTTGGPRDNDQHWCGYCGGLLVVLFGWSCPACGPGPVKVDEDGCCAHCGADATYHGEGEGA